MQSKRKIDLIFVQITPECNLNCKYCPFSFDRLEKKKPDVNNNKQIESFRNTLTNDKFDKKSFGRLVLYGGEPLINREQIVNIVKEYKKLRPKGTISLCTNGLLITFQIIKFLKENKIEVSINLDGSYPVVSRYKKISRSTYNQLLKNINMLRKNGISYNFSTSLTPKFLSRFKKEVYYLESLKPKAIGYNFIRDKAGRRKCGIINREKYLFEAAEKVFSHKSKKNFNFEKRRKAIISKGPIDDCVCFGLGFTVLSSGLYTTCGIFDDKHIFSSIKDVIYQYDKNRNKYFNKSVTTTYGGGCSKVGVSDNKIYSKIIARISNKHLN